MLHRIIILIMGVSLSSNLRSQSEKGLLEISFADPIEGIITIHGWSSASNNRWSTLDSTKIVEGKYTYQYERTEEEILTPIFIDLYLKDSILSKRLFIANPHFDSYSHDIRLENNHVIIQVNSIPSSKKEKLVGKIQGSLETDVEFRLFSEIYSEHKFQFTDSTQYHVVDFDFIKKYDKSLVLLEKIYGDRNLYSLDSLQLAFSLFDKSLQKSKLANKLSTFIKQQKLYDENGINANFLFYDTIGKKYTFQDYIGDKKMGLIIFWASWCGPCIREIPELIRMYKEFGDKVAFASLSVDEKKPEWIKSVNRYPVNWLNLTGFPDSKTKVVDKFGVTFVPSFLIVDNTGRILLDSQRGREKTANGYKEVQVKIINLPDYLKFFLSK